MVMSYMRLHMLPGLPQGAEHHKSTQLHTPNMGPSWAQDGPSWGQVGIKFGQVGSENQLLEGLGPQDPPRASQDPSKPEKQEEKAPPLGSVLEGFWGHVCLQELLKGHSKGIQNFDRF